MKTDAKISQQNNEAASVLKEFEHILKDRAGYLKKASRPAVAWSSVYTPEEVLHAGGLMPFRLTGENRPESSKSRAILSGGVCPYVLSCLEEV
ncbi:MAG: 2-hydroxyacyl-CoA dehydratase family protein [Candidatus Omnitrophota bacterium]|nr:2-hydroxyacyl-CoA dehydratase family protein [Candidatus Omnitrophota bacterium]